jgi:cyclopropane fatty-acyl-phospholipid synthase-like methyltransferase
MKIKNCCPLCLGDKISFFSKDQNRDYYQCSDCKLVFVLSENFLSAKDEKAKYDHHQNSIENSGYCQFLDRLLIPMQSYLKDGAKGLDFGSGPGPTLSIIMNKRGYDISIYDYFYENNPKVFESKYDFITSTEVIEHLHDVGGELDRLWQHLGKGGVLGLMSAFIPKNQQFDKWYYIRDLTHVRFFSRESFRWLAKNWDADVVFPQDGVAIFLKR